MADPFEKWELTWYIRMYFQGRIELKPREYEGGEDFQKTFKDAFSTFVKTLFTKNFEGAGNRLDSKTLDGWIARYNINKPYYSDFLENFKNKFVWFKDKPDELISKQILRFAIILN